VYSAHASTRRNFLLRCACVVMDGLNDDRIIIRNKNKCSYNVINK